MIHGAVIVGLDETLEAARAAALGWRLAAASGVPCHLVHAVPDVTNDALLGSTADSAMQLRSRVHHAARQAVMRAQRGSISAEALACLEIRSGKPVAALEQAVHEYQGALVVLGGKRHSALSRWIEGSTAHAAVRRLRVPVLVTAWIAPELRRVLVAVDSSAAAAPAIATARAIASLWGAAVRVLHVVEPDPLVSAVPTFDTTDAALPSVGRFREELAPSLGDTELVVHCGAPAREIAHVAAAWRADLIVVGSHGHGWFSRMVLGSVTEQLLAHLPASLLIAPAPETGQTQARLVASDPACAGLTVAGS